MPQPAELLPKEDPLVEAYRKAWEQVNQLWQTVADDPIQQVKARRLQEIQRSIARLMSETDDVAAEWVANSLPDIYLAGMGGGAGSGGAGELIWTQIHQQAAQTLAQDLFNDLLDATKGVNETTKSMIRSIGKDAALQQAVAGRTAQDAAREMRRLLEQQGVYSVIYKDGSKHGLAEYSQVAIRTKSAVAYNTGTLNQHPNVQWWEVFDGPDCGWSFHDDPTLASGLIVTREQAAAFPISHPNCRRAFAPRPDVTSAQQVKELAKNPNTVGSGNVTVAQNEAQKAADQSRRGAKSAKTAQTSKTAKKGPTGGPKGGLPDTLPSPAPDALDNVIDKSKFEEPGKAFGPGEKNRGYARKADVPSITQLIDAGWSPGEAVTENERLLKNAGNVERRAKKKLAEVQAKNSQQFTAVNDTPIPPAEDLASNKIAEQGFEELKAQDSLKRQAEQLNGQAKTNPLILFDRGSSIPWHDQLLFDSGSSIIPVRGLTIEGYKVQYGIAIRRNGRSYLLEVSKAEDISAAAIATLEKSVATVEAALTSVPENLRGIQRGVAIVKGANPQDAKWAKQYSMPGFKSAATGGGGSATYWGTEVKPGTFLHEFGHNLDSQYSKISSNANVWEKASVQDTLSSKGHTGFQGSIYGHKITPGLTGITEYGAKSASEDFAESVRLYLADRHKGFLGYSSVGGKQISVRFADVFPERAKVLDGIFGFDPVVDTPWQQLAKERAIKGFVDNAYSNPNTLMQLYGVDKTTAQQIIQVSGPAEKAKVEAAAAAAKAKAAAEAAAKAAEEKAKAEALAKVKAELTYEKLTFSDKTSIGLKKSNAYKKALKMGATEDEAKGIAQTVYDKELHTKLVTLAKEKGIDPSLLDVPTSTGQLLGGGVLKPNFRPEHNQRGTDFLRKAGTTKHPLANKQGSSVTQAKANIAAELASRLGKDPEIRKLMGQFTSPGMYDTVSPGAVRAKLDSICSDLVQRWAGSSGDSHPNSLVLQMAIKEEFGLNSEVFVRGVAPLYKNQAEALYLKEGPLVRKFVRAMYDHTQEELAKEGITELSLYRGMKMGTRGSDAVWSKHGSVSRPVLQPANSWSTSSMTSQNFGGTRLTATIPANRILGSARTGFGCLNEWEFVVLDSDGSVAVNGWSAKIP